MPNPAQHRRERRIRIHKRIRLRLRGEATKPRLSVSFSGKHIYAQVIDDSAGKTLVAASSLEEGLKKSIRANVAGAAKLGQAVAERASKKGVSDVVFDRGGFLYHGKVKAFAEAARTAGLKF